MLIIFVGQLTQMFVCLNLQVLTKFCSTYIFKFQEENGAAWISWLLDAIHKIKYQKQRPNVERVAACIRQHHPQYSNETVFQVLILVNYIA